MINVKLGRRGYSMSFVTEGGTFGPAHVRNCVVCDVYEYYNGHPTWINRGIAVLHPQDNFDARIGSKKALQSATWVFSHTERKIFQDALESWFSHGQDV